MSSRAGLGPYVKAECLEYYGLAGLCDRCGTKLRGRQRRWCGKGCSDWYFNNHAWAFARPYRIATDQGRCTASVVCYQEPLEVDHIFPRNGQPIHSHSCAHHQENLRTLCHQHHVTRKDWDASNNNPTV